MIIENRRARRIALACVAAIVLVVVCALAALFKECSKVAHVEKELALDYRYVGHVIW